MRPVEDRNLVKWLAVPIQIDDNRGDKFRLLKNILERDYGGGLPGGNNRMQLFMKLFPVVCNNAVCKMEDLGRRPVIGGEFE